MKDIIIFGGQSNMQGQCERLTGDTPVRGAEEYRFLTDTLIPLRNPTGEDVRCDGTAGFPFGAPDITENWHEANAIGSTCYGRTSLRPFFCEAYLAASGRDEVVAVHAAKGATAMDHWTPDSKGTEILVKKCEAAFAKVGETGERYMIWLQGESDAIAGRPKEEYKKMLSAFAHCLKDRLGLCRFCIIRVGCFTMDEKDWEIINAQEELCREDPFFLMLTRVCSDYCTKEEYKHFMNPEAHGHYSAAGLESIGRLAGTALGETV